MDPRMYPQGSQSINPADVEAAPTMTDLIETFDASNTNDRKAISILNATRDQIKILGSETTLTLTAADHNRIIAINHTDNCVITLPPTVAGLRFRVFAVQPAGAGKLVKVSPNANDKIIAKGFTLADNKAAQHTQATAALGDGIELVGDGVDGWYATLTGTWAREA